METDSNEFEFIIIPSTLIYSHPNSMYGKPVIAGGRHRKEGRKEVGKKGEGRRGGNKRGRSR